MAQLPLRRLESLGLGLPLPCWEPVSATGCGASFVLSDHAPGLPLVFVEVTWAAVPGVEPELACPHWGPWPRWML